MKRVLIAITFVIMAAITLTSCGGAKAGLVDANSITYDGKVFNWAEAQNAASYEVTIGEGTKQITSSTMYAYTAKKNDDIVSITICSVNAKGKASEESVNKVFNRLATITEIRFDEYGNAEWNSVDGASEYIVKLNGKDVKTSNTAWMKEDFVVGKTNSISVKPSSENGFADFSKVYNKVYLAAPTDISYDGVTISWKGSSDARYGYEVFVNGISQGTTTSSSMVYNSLNMSFEVAVKALGDSSATHAAFESAESPAESYVYLETVQDLAIQKGKLVWSPIENANGYKLKIDQSVSTVVSTEYNITPGESHTYQVQPIVSDSEGVHYFSSYCEELIGRVLKAPELRWDKNAGLDDGDAAQALYWANDGITKQGYNILITLKADGQTTTPVDTFIGSEMNTYGYGFNAVGEYTVQLQNVAVPNGTDYDSAYSQPITVIRLAAPELGSITSNPDNQNLGFTVNLNTKPSSQASSYKITQEGVENISVKYDGDQIKVLTVSGFNDFEEHQLTYKVQSIGAGLSNVNGKQVVVLNSLRSKNLSFSVTVLAAPKNIKFQGMDASWDPVDKASNGYNVSIGSDPVTQSNYSLSQLAIGPADFYVVARGDGEAVLASRQSETRKVVRIARPTNVSVDLVNETYQLNWTGVPNASSYNIYFNGDKEPTKAEGSLAVDRYLTSTGLTIDIVAVGKGEDSDANKTYYIDSPNMSEPIKMFLLEAPTFGEQLVFGDVLKWNAPANDNLEQHTPTYNVYNVSYDFVYEGVVRSTGFSLEGHDCQPGMLSFAVRAIGDGKTYITSKKSATVTFTYLATPVISCSGNKYTWGPIDGASGGYALRIGDSTPITFSPATTEYVIDSQYFQNIKTYDVSITALGDGGYSVVDSKPNRFKQEVARENKPTDSSFSIAYVDPERNPLTEFAANGQILFTINSALTNSKTYTININNNDVLLDSENGLTYMYAVNVNDLYKVKYRGNGGYFGANNVFYIQSEYSEPKSIAILPTPGGLNRSQTQLSWNAIQNADYLDKYHVVVTVAGMESPLVFDVKEPRITNAQLAAAGVEVASGQFAALKVTSYTVQAIAKYGNINSAPSQPAQFTSMY